jgi:hypothetical protein
VEAARPARLPAVTQRLSPPRAGASKRLSVLLLFLLSVPLCQRLSRRHGFPVMGDRPEWLELTGRNETVKNRVTVPYVRPANTQRFSTG